MPKHCANEADLDNIEAWAEIVEDVLWSAPADKRAAILALAVEKEKKAAAERAERGPLQFMRFDQATNDAFLKSPRMRHWNAIMRLKSLLIQIFVRNITNNHSSKDASQILFAEQRHGTGSGRLWDYIHDLPELENVR